MAPSLINTVEEHEFNDYHHELPVEAKDYDYIARDATLSSHELVSKALHEHVESVNQEICEPGDEDTFFVADLGDVYRQHLRWKRNLSRVQPHYGM